MWPTPAYVNVAHSIEDDLVEVDVELRDLLFQGPCNGRFDPGDAVQVGRLSPAIKLSASRTS